MNKDKLQEFEPLFYPKSIAVVGVSKNGQKYGNMFMQAFLSSGFKGPVYPVNANSDTILGRKAYPDVKSIPEEVDYVIIAIPATKVPGVLDDCIAKGVKVVQIFSAGFREMGGEQETKLEQELVKRARKGNFRIIGPNCIGIYYPASHMPYSPIMPPGRLGKSGTIAFIAQSGQNARRVIELGMARQINFSKVISFGNGADLDSTDFLEYLAADPETKVIGAYLEGVRNARYLFQLCKEIAKTKPLVIWKGGRTNVGAEAAASHTGALATSDAMWATALKQAGAVIVDSIEEMTDTLLAFQHLPSFEGRGVTSIAGLGTGGGGDCVAAADICLNLGIEMPAFLPDTRKQLEAILPLTGSFLRNPLDVSQAYGDVTLITRSTELAATDPQIKLVIVYEYVEYLPDQNLNEINDFLINLKEKQGKTVVLIMPPGLSEDKRLEVENKFAEAQVPVFSSLERAAKALANVSAYYSRK